MQVGDLVKFFSDESDHAGELGVIIRKIHAGSKKERMLVQWPSGPCPAYPARQLEVVNESR